jgi:hypothetical protein
MACRMRFRSRELHASGPEIHQAGIRAICSFIPPENGRKKRVRLPLEGV